MNHTPQTISKKSKRNPENHISKDFKPKAPPAITRPPLQKLPPPSENLHQPKIINQTIECVHFKQSVTKFQLRYWNFSAFGAPPRHPFFPTRGCPILHARRRWRVEQLPGIGRFFFSGWRCSIDDQSTGPGPKKQMMMMMICGGNSNKEASNRGLRWDQGGRT